MRHLLLMAWLLWAPAAAAVTIEQPLPDARQEAVAQDAIAQLKCVVCEGQALGGSDATFAREMRQEIRRMAAQGHSTQEILDYFRSRYGAEILQSPPLEPFTWLLWFGPWLLIAGGGIMLWRHTSRGSHG